MPRYLVVPFSVKRAWATEGRLNVRGTINGIPFEHRSVLPFGDGRHFVNLPEALCRRAGVEVGDKVTVELESQAEALPPELDDALDASAGLRVAWQRLPTGRRRQLSAYVREAKRPETRARRACAVLAELHLST